MKNNQALKNTRQCDKKCGGGSLGDPGKEVYGYLLGGNLSGLGLGVGECSQTDSGLWEEQSWKEWIIIHWIK